MLLKVNPHKIEIVKSPVNEREINISKCTFEFADEITNDYVKEAYFTFGGTTYKQIIVNDECDFPSEVLTKKGTIEIGVVAYLVENETEIKRYNPSPAYFDTWIGSLKDKAENSEPITPSEMEQFEQALNDGLNEVNDKLDEIDQAIDDVNEAIIETNNLDLDVDKQGKVATVTLTKKDASTKTVTLSDGTSLMFNWDGTKLGIKTDEDAEYTYVDLQGVQGPIGPKGEAFTIKKTYTSIAEMNADFNNMQLGDYVMIASTVEVEDNAKLYTRGETQWIFISDFSGATGIRGETGLTPNIQIGTVTSGATPNVTRTGTNENPIFNFTLVKGDTGATGPQGETGATGNGILSIQKTATSGLVDTYTITFTDGTTTTFNVTNGEDGEVTQAQLDETNDNVSWLQTLTEQMPHVAGQGTDLSLENVLNYRLMKFLPQGVSSQESTTGKNSLPNNATSQTINGITFIVYDDGTIIANGTATATASLIINSNLAVNGTFVLTSGLGISTNYYMRALDRNNGYAVVMRTDNNNIPTATLDTNIQVLIYVANGVTCNNVVFKPMLRLSSITDDTYEPYTGGIPAPNPSYPYPVKSVTGENSLVLQNKNLFNKNKNVNNTFTNSIATALQHYKDTNEYATGYVSSGNNIVTNASYITSFTPCTSGETYTINNTYSAAANFSSICFIDDNGNIISRSNAWSNNAYTHTATSDEKYIMCGIGINESGVDYRNYIQIEKNSQSTTYVEHEEQNYQLSFGNMEFNSSPDGTIRDAIIGKPNEWYKREYIGKVVLDGSEDENWTLNTTNNPFYNISNVFYGSQNLNNTSLCSHFQIRNTITAADTNTGIFGSATGHYFRIRLETMMSLEEFKLWLQAQSQAGTPVSIYYLKTNEDIPITDTTLINQLNDIYNNAHSYKGTTNITSTYEDGNEQMYLDIETLKNVWDTSL